MPSRPDLRGRAQRLRRRLLRHRRALAALLAGLAVLAATRAVTAPPPATVGTWVAAHPLSSGSVLSPADLSKRRFAPGTAPQDAITDPDEVIGHTLATPLRAGVPLTVGDVVADGWLRDREGLSAVPVRITDPGVVPLLSVGDAVQLVAATADRPADAQVLAQDARVLAIPHADQGQETTPAGRLVVLGVPPGSAARISGLAGSHFLTVVWTH